MTPTRKYAFRPVTAADIALLAQWAARPHVQKWWGTDEPVDKQALGDQRVTRKIVTLGTRPFAYMQDYTPHGWDGHYFAHLPDGSRGIDQFIGEADLIGLGHGPAFIARRVAQLFASGAPVVATDPHPDNTQAIAAYEKAGFRAFDGPLDTRWGTILPMKIMP